MNVCKQRASTARNDTAILCQCGAHTPYFSIATHEPHDGFDFCDGDNSWEYLAPGAAWPEAAFRPDT